MVNTADLWKKLLENAGLFGLDPAEFQKLETFFAGLDPAYFLNCAGRTIDDFPLEEVKKRFAPEELGVFLQLCFNGLCLAYIGFFVGIENGEADLQVNYLRFALL